MNHFYGVHQCWESFTNLLWSAFIQRFKKLLQSRQVLDVVLSFIKFISQQQIKSIVVHHKFRDIFISSALLSFMLLLSLKGGFNRLEISAFELLRPIRNFLHSCSPIVEFDIWACIWWLPSLIRIVIQEIINCL